MDFKTLLNYDPLTGELTWRERPVEGFKDERSRLAWNGRFSGTKAGIVQSKKGKPVALALKIWNKKVYAHRAIWEMNYGEIPEGMMIDHIDGNPLNNRLDNLRLATNSQNQFNRKTKENATSGFKGVSYDPVRDKWKAEITVRTKRITIGRYSTKEEAHSAYQEAAIKYAGDFARFQ